VPDDTGKEAAKRILAQPVDPETGEFGDDVTLTTDDVTTMGSKPNNTENMGTVATWNQSYKVYGGWPERLMLTTDHALTVYRSKETDPDGRYLYFYWQWSQATTNDDYWHDMAHLEAIESEVNIKTYHEMVTNFSPSTTSDINGQWVRVGVSAEYSGTSFGVQGDVYVKDGTFGPKTGYVTVGRSGKYRALYDAAYIKGTHSLNATTATRTTDYKTLLPEVEWTTKCKAKE
jgi:hypothetical protein